MENFFTQKLDVFPLYITSMQLYATQLIFFHSGCVVLLGQIGVWQQCFGFGNKCENFRLDEIPGFHGISANLLLP